MTRKVAAICLALVCGAGCTSYYKVMDPTTGKTYYSTNVERKGSGAATLKDGRTGNTVNLQNSEIAQITKEEYEAGRFTQPQEAEKPAPNPFGR